MLKVPTLEVITKGISNNSIGLDSIITEKRLLKTKIKLLQIALFDNDLKNLNSNGFDLASIELKDFRFLDGSNLVVPVYDKIIPAEDQNNILESYLIYLSYLYNIDLVTLYKTNYHLFYEIILSIELPPEIKMNLFELIKYNKGEYFSANIEGLNSAEYRENISKDERRLRRINVN